jgi:hypothetical protein
MRFPRTSLLLFSCCISSYSYAEFIFFPMLDLVDVEGETLDLQSIIPAATFYYAEEGDTFSILAEAAVSEKRQNLERFQVGVKVSPNSTLWLGRGHTPYGYWNTQYHHGSYLNNSITAPGSIVGGMLNRHLTGLEWDAEFQLENQASVKFEYMLGYAPKYTGEVSSFTGLAGFAASMDDRGGSFTDFDLLDPGNLSEHDIGQTVRLSYNGLGNPENSMGVFYSNNKYKAEVNFKQQSGGVFANWQGQRWRGFGGYYWIENEINQTHITRYGWVQGEYNQGDYTWFSRFEKSHGDIDDTVFPMFTEETYIFGLRFDFAQRQAIKIEYSQQKSAKNQLRIEWSGYIN